MRNFNQGNNRFGGNRRDFAGKPSMFKTVCSKCGQDCEVPFRPTGTRPVYCNNCFDRNRSSESNSRPFERKSYSDRGQEPARDSGNNNAQLIKQLEALNWKLDKIVKLMTPNSVPEKKPIIDKTILIAKKKKTKVKKEVIA